MSVQNCCIALCWLVNFLANIHSDVWFAALQAIDASLHVRHTRSIATRLLNGMYLNIKTRQSKGNWWHGDDWVAMLLRFNSLVCCCLAHWLSHSCVLCTQWTGHSEGGLKISARRKEAEEGGEGVIGEEPSYVANVRTRTKQNVAQMPWLMRPQTTHWMKMLLLIFSPFIIPVESTHWK